MSGPDEGSAASPWRTPSLGRRLSCLMYEGVLLFGVVWAAGLAYSLATGQRHAMSGQTGMQIVQFLVLGAYFIWFWSRTGQTLPMQTWNIRLVTATGAPLTRWRAACRYLVAWLWFLPALAAAYLADIRGGLAVSVILLAGVLTYALLTRLHPRRQFMHDAICGTQLVEWKAPRPR